MSQGRAHAISQLLSQFVMRGLVLGGMTLLLGIGHVWLNMERTGLAYEYRAMEESLQEKKTLISKLQLERENLISPYRLKEMAGKLGLAPAQPGQIRKLSLMARDMGPGAPH